MIADPWLSWALVVLFACSAGYCAWKLLRPGSWQGRFGHAFHLLMCLSMLAMVKPGAPNAPYAAQVVVFAAAAVWFGLSAVLRGPRYQGLAEFVCASGRATACYHTAMMAAASWMAVLMGGWLIGGARPEAPDAAAASSGSHAPLWTTVSDVALGALFLVAALWWVRQYFELRKNDSGAGRSAPAEAESLCEVAMALGMGVMFLAMA